VEAGAAFYNEHDCDGLLALGGWLVWGVLRRR